MKKIIDILGIVLPALIIILGITRVFMTKTKGVNGLTMLFAILLLLVGIIRYSAFMGGNGSGENGIKPPALSVSVHSEAFNLSLEKILNAYYEMNTGFAENNITAINEQGASLKITLDSLKLEDLKKDSLIYQTALQPYENTKAEINSIIGDPSIEEKRGSLNILSNELFAFLTTVRYDQAVLYWLECDQAFGEGKPGNWISKVENAQNPYGQKDCRDVKTKINFINTDSTKVK
jgi:hypothetical protein